MSQHFVLAGGGHSHALILRRWAMQHNLRPKGLITLVNRHSTTLYSGMVPGLVAGLYPRNALEIDLSYLCNQAGVALVIAEITGIDCHNRKLLLADRPAITYDYLSLNVGSITTNQGHETQKSELSIKPLEPALNLLKQKGSSNEISRKKLHLIGSGMAAIELAFALRHQHEQQKLVLNAYIDRVPLTLQRGLKKAGIDLQFHSNKGEKKIESNLDASNCIHLRCTGSQAPRWLAESGLPVDERGRVRTHPTLEVLNHFGIFAAGDCAVVDKNPRPPSGVWAVRSAKPLARNLEALSQGKPLRGWIPQRHALQLLGGFDSGQRPTAWALWGKQIIGPHPWLWKLKQHIDKQFMAMLQKKSPMKHNANAKVEMLCRGCAAKLPATPLKEALEQAGLKTLGSAPEDAASIPNIANIDGEAMLQSIDGFPALISDSWINGRITTLHACSDLWACGAKATSAQAVITLPLTSPSLQRELLSQTLAGINSALKSQNAQLIGGHTLETRSSSNSTSPISLDIQVALCVQGSPDGAVWRKQGIQRGDQLLLSRPLGTGVMFAAAMTGHVRTEDLDQAVRQMLISQDYLVDELRSCEKNNSNELHACTDITGFGLLGHLGEMLENTEDKNIQVSLNASQIPSLRGALELFKSGHSSSISGANKASLNLIEPSYQGSSAGKIRLRLGKILPKSQDHLALLELLVDPQTCGPLLISTTPKFAKSLMKNYKHNWHLIGEVMSKRP